MNYLFRPTPVLTLGHDRGADRVALTKTPAGMMHGWPMGKYSPSRSHGLQGDPWLVRSGSMATFGTMGNEPLRGLGDDFGDDDFSSDFDTSLPDDFFNSAYNSPIIPVSYSGAGESPIIPSPTLYTDGAPDFGGFSVPFQSPLQTVMTAPPPPPAAVPGGAGATGFGIPGTQPINKPAAAIVPSVAQSAPSLATQIANLFTPKPTAGSLVIPGVGINPNTAAYSAPFLASSTIIPGYSNGTVLAGGAVALLALGLVMSMGSGKKR
jgi:hypothetical protein